MGSSSAVWADTCAQQRLSHAAAISICMATWPAMAAVMKQAVCSMGTYGMLNLPKARQLDPLGGGASTCLFVPCSPRLATGHIATKPKVNTNHPCKAICAHAGDE